MSQIVNAVTKLHLPEEILHAMTKRAASVMIFPLFL